MKFPFEKLVRRHVPDQLRALGEKIETRIAEPGEMLKLLRDKLVEEVQELIEAIDAGAEDQIIEELADVREVINGFSGPHLKTKSGSWLGNEAASRQQKKWEEKGSFRNIVMKLDEPVPHVIHCPKCGGQHIDRGIWATIRVHRTHLCEHCGETFRPFSYASVGVA